MSNTGSSSMFRSNRSTSYKTRIKPLFYTNLTTFCCAMASTLNDRIIPTRISLTRPFPTSPGQTPTGTWDIFRPVNTTNCRSTRFPYISIQAIYFKDKSIETKLTFLKNNLDRIPVLDYTTNKEHI